MMNEQEGVLVYRELDSTNSQLAKLLREMYLPEGTTVRAVHQTAGRGQINNSWESEDGANLTFSTYLSPMIEPQEQFIMNMAVSLALYDTLTPHLSDLFIKWPNDLFCRDKKLAGILIESVIKGMRIHQTIIGVGLNVNQNKFSDHLPLAASMHMITGQIYDQEELLENFLRYLQSYYLDIKAGKHESIRALYQERLYRKDQMHQYHDGTETFTGSIRGVNELGKLELETEGGAMRTYAFKEVSYLY